MDDKRHPRVVLVVGSGHPWRLPADRIGYVSAIGTMLSEQSYATFDRGLSDWSSKFNTVGNGVNGKPKVASDRLRIASMMIERRRFKDSCMPVYFFLQARYTLAVRGRAAFQWMKSAGLLRQPM